MARIEIKWKELKDFLVKYKKIGKKCDSAWDYSKIDAILSNKFKDEEMVEVDEKAYEKMKDHYKELMDSFYNPKPVIYIEDSNVEYAGPNNPYRDT
jgi:hypothetical protein